MSRKKLVAAIALRNQGSRLYGKPIQNLDVDSGITILDNIIECLSAVDAIDSIVLGIAEGVENEIYKLYASEKKLRYIVGDEIDVLGRLIKCCQEAQGTDIFRVTSESPFPTFYSVEEVWKLHQSSNADATFLDDIVDGCGFEIISLDALVKSHESGEDRHRSELCSLYIRENNHEFETNKMEAPEEFNRTDLRLTVDNPEDLVVCRHVYSEFRELAPMIPLEKIIQFLDRRPDLKALTAPFTSSGYDSMYIWEKEND